MSILTFGYSFNQKIKPNSLPTNLTILNFGWRFNQKIEPNTLPDNLITIEFGENFDQKIDIQNFPPNLTNIIFNLVDVYNKISKSFVHMVNNIPNYYNVELFFTYNIFKIGPKWPIHVVGYDERGWSPKIYDVIDKYQHPYHGKINILVNKKTYQPYSYAKSARK